MPDQDSNLDKQNQNLLCYRYTIGHPVGVIYRMAVGAGKVQISLGGEFLILLWDLVLVRLVRLGWTRLDRSLRRASRCFAKRLQPPLFPTISICDTRPESEVRDCGEVGYAFGGTPSDLPPSMAMQVPVTIAAASLARYMMASATSSGVIIRR